MGVVDLSADVNGIYVTSGSVFKIPSGGGTQTNLTPTYTPIGGLEAVTNDFTTVYFTDYAVVTTRLCSVSKGGGSVTILASVSDAVRNIAIDGKNVYARGAKFVYSVPLGGGTATTLAPSDGAIFSVPAIDTDGTNVYWSSAAPAGIVAMPVGGGLASVIYTGPVGPIITAGSYIYFDSNGLVARTKPTWSGQYQPLFVGGSTMAYENTNNGYVLVADGQHIWQVDAWSIVTKEIIADSIDNFKYHPFVTNGLSVFWIDMSGNIKQAPL